VAGSGGAASAGSSGAPAAGSGGAGTAGSAGAASAGAAGSAGGAGSSGGSGGAGGASAGAGGASGSSGSGSAGTGGAAPFALTSPSIMAKAGCTKDALAQCDRFGLDFCLQTIGGKNQSPELNWTAGPAGTLSYAMSLYDESNGFAHWVIWNIPGSTSKLPAMLAAGDSPSGVTGAKQLSFHQTGNLYAGPGANSHAYVFKLYALKTATFSPNIPAGNNKQVSVRMQLESSADVLAKVELRAASPQ
jgi:Raf kinase inhibitor-like YbhB/YbcL family protein